MSAITPLQPSLDIRVKSLIVEMLTVDAAEVLDHRTLNTDLGADSLDRIELFMALEDDFGIEISDPEAERVATVGDVVELVRGKVMA